MNNTSFNKEKSWKLNLKKIDSLFLSMKKEEIRKTLLVCSFAIWGILANEKAVSQENSNPLEKSNVAEVQSGSSIINLLSNFIWRDDKNFEINKENLNEFYNSYIESRWRLWSYLDLYLKSKIYDFYLRMLENWYSIDWYKELDELIEKIRFLSDWDLKIRMWNSMPENSEFSKKITIVWEVKWKEIILEEKKCFILCFNNKIDETNISLNINRLLSSFLLDLPVSYQDALNRLWEERRKYIGLENTLRETDRTVWKLNHTILWLRKEIENLENQIKINNENYLKEKEELSKQAEANLQRNIRTLTDKYEKEKEELNKIIWTKEKKYSELQEKHRQALEKAEQDVRRERVIAEDNLRRSQTSLNRDFNIEKERLQWQINNLRQEVERYKKLLQSQNVSLEEEGRSLRDVINEYNKRIIELENQIKTLQNENVYLHSLNENKTDLLEEKQNEIDKLITEKNEMIEQHQLVIDTTNQLLMENRSALETSENLIRRLENQIKELREQRELNAALEENQALKTSNNRLQEQINILNQRLDNSQRNESSLRTQIDQMRSTLSMLQSSNITSSNVAEAEKIEDLQRLNRDLQSQIKNLNLLTEENRIQIERLQKEKTDIEYSYQREITKLQDEHKKTIQDLTRRFMWLN